MVWGWINARTVQAFLGGVTLLVTLYFVAVYLGDVVDTTDDFGSYRLIFVALFVGTSTGYYLGKAAAEEGGPVLAFILGVLVTLTSAVVYFNGISPITGVLVLSGVTLFLVYNSGLADSTSELERWVGRTKNLAVIGLIGIAFLQYGVPIVTRSARSGLQRAQELQAWLGDDPHRWVFAVLVAALSAGALYVAWRIVVPLTREVERM